MSRRKPEASPDPPEPVEPALPVPAESARLPAEAPAGTRDALTHYMAQLGAHPPISREEEHELAVRWVEEGDQDAARQLVVANLRLVVKIAMEYRRAWTHTLDLIQEGNVGLMEAVARYDPYQGVKLSSYAVYWIRAYVLKFLMDNIRLVRLGTTRAQRKLFFRLNKEKRELEKQGFEVEPRLLAERLEVSEEDVMEMEARLGEQDQSLDAPIQRDSSRATIGDLMSNPSDVSAEDQVGDAELRRLFMERVHDFVEELDEREQRIVRERILAEDRKTLQELGEELDLTRERVRQIEKKVVDRLREHLRGSMVDFEYYEED